MILCLTSLADQSGHGRQRPHRFENEPSFRPSRSAAVIVNVRMKFSGTTEAPGRFTRQHKNAEGIFGTDKV
jgi:hypothetical protein